MDRNEIERNNNPHKNKVHKVLAHSYSTYFILFLIGVALDIFFRVEIFANSVAVPAGLALLFLATILIFWAQITTRNLKKENITIDTFCRGPYCYTRSPTHWGLFFLILGFGITINAVFVVLSTLISFLISRFVFLDRQEKILEKKYGHHYLEYKKLVRF